MYYNLFVTHDCNLSCRYCGGLDEYVPVPREVQYDVSELKRFVMQDEDRVITFYGGEPLLRIPLIRRIMDEIPARAFIIQTNGTLLHRLPDEYLSRLHTILLSLDGDRETTDYYRGAGVFDRVLENARKLRDRGFTGFLVARMAAPLEADIDKNVRYLAGTGLFDKIHWQLNAQFNETVDLDETRRLIETVYNPGITRLVEFWWKTMQQEGRVPGIMPFVGVMNGILTQTPAGLRCGAGMVFHSIGTSGHIYPCPEAATEHGPQNLPRTGHICRTTPTEIRNSMTIGDPCPRCEIYDLCGGRCLFANRLKPWGEAGFSLICGTVFHLVNCLQSFAPGVRALIEEDRLRLSDFDYFRYDGCEIIP